MLTTLTIISLENGIITIIMGAAKKEIKFIYDSKGNKTDVVIPLDSYADQLEDFFDIQAVEKQKNEKAIPFKDVEKRFKEKHA